MAFDFPDLTYTQIIQLLLKGPLPSEEEAQLVDRINTAIARGDFPVGVFRDPITQAQITAVLSDPNTTVDTRAKIDKIFRDAGTVGALPSIAALLPTLVEPGLFAGMDVDNWVVRQVRTIVDTIANDPNTSRELRETFHSLTSDNLAWLYKAGMSAIKQVVDIFAAVSAGATPIAGQLAGQTMNQILGVKVDDQQLFNLFSGAPSRASVVGIGEQFQKVVNLMFPIDAAVEHAKNRADRSFAIDNMEAFMGTNMAFQLRSLSIGTIASFVPHFNLEHLEGLHNTINWAYGFGWLSWTVLSAVMDNTTTKPLKEYYNSKIKSNDFTEGDALKAFIQGRIPDTTLTNILNNLGIRDDIRADVIDMHRVGMTAANAVKALNEGIIDETLFKREMDNHLIREDVRDKMREEARPQLTESDVQLSYDHGLFTESDVSDHYKRKGFADFNLQAKIDLVKDDRLFKLQQQLTTDYFRAFVLGKVTQDEFVTWLNSQHYTQLQVDIELQRAALDKKVTKIHGLTVSEVLAQVTRGAWSATQGLERLLAMGWDRQDASDLLSLAILDHYTSKIPRKVKEAYEEEHPWATNLASALQVVLELDPTYPLRAKDYVAEVARLIELATK